MAFNLNKSDGSDESANSKFNLSKSDTPGVESDATTGKTKTLVYIVIGFLIVAVGSWYLFFNNKPKLDNASSSIQGAQSTDSVKITPAATQNNKAITSNEISNVVPIKNKIPVSFSSGAITFDTINQSAVDDILLALSTNPESSLEIRGYASSEGSLAINQSISQARADAFKDYLLSKNVKEDRIKALGKGIENPIASNQTAAGRKKNRRVEIDIK
ncbi:OmpA family protein [Pedobacter sp. B4-66]|uniref:OmpA family protein n=1 Tax=Pedobacter sp. B4-66 TaxID=2817280 RepID=UPI001BDA618F|nr:OmpA family protein [Pedobacter sp. B4-66]